MGEGVWAPFFRHPAYTMTLVSRLLQLPGVTPILMWAERLPHGRGFHMHFSPMSPAPEGDAALRAEHLNRQIEALILQNPVQYLWGYNRYKVPAGVAAPAKDATC